MRTTSVLPLPPLHHRILPWHGTGCLPILITSVLWTSTSKVGWWSLGAVTDVFVHGPSRSGVGCHVPVPPPRPPCVLEASRGAQGRTWLLAQLPLVHSVSDRLGSPCGRGRMRMPTMSLPSSSTRSVAWLCPHPTTETSCAGTFVYVGGSWRSDKKH